MNLSTLAVDLSIVNRAHQTDLLMQTYWRRNEFVYNILTFFLLVTKCCIDLLATHIGFAVDLLAGELLYVATSLQQISVSI